MPRNDKKVARTYGKSVPNGDHTVVREGDTTFVNRTKWAAHCTSRNLTTCHRRLSRQCAHLGLNNFGCSIKSLSYRCASRNQRHSERSKTLLAFHRTAVLLKSIRDQ